MLDVMIFEYVPFIILLGALFIISGGILVKGDIVAKPLNNSIFLTIGALLASVIGTTGAAMLLIRPFLNTNKQRKYKVHSVVFFIFTVCNIGGLLTPLGDPPLFLGYLKGVPFTWTLSLTPQWFFTLALLISIYFIWDTVLYRMEPVRSQKKNHEPRPLVIRGKINFLYLGGVVLSVAFLNNNVLGFIPATPDPYEPASYLAFIREFVMVMMVFLSVRTTPKMVRLRNHFTLHPIEEVAFLFIGIFLTMIPALMILDSNTDMITKIMSSPAHFFWGTGLLSSFLDNAPTYVTFFTAAGIDPHAFTKATVRILSAISMGAVFMGAVTYIGNGPNFMVKAIAEETGLRMPSFFGYIKYSALILIPLFILVTFVFI